MGLALEAHFAAAFLALLCGVFIGWVPLGRGVVVIVLGVEIALGLAAVIVSASKGAPLAQGVWIHAAGGLLAAAAYGSAIALQREPKRAAAEYTLSFAGLVLVIATLWYGAFLTTHR